MRRRFNALLAGLVPGLVGAVLVLTPLGAEFEQDFGLTWLFHVRGALASPSSVAVISIDSDTARHMAEMNLDLGPGGPRRLSTLPRDWPRTVHGRLLEGLARLGAAVVVFDMDFSRAKYDADDRAFAAAMKASDRVILFQRLTGKRQPLQRADGTRTGSIWVERTVPPIAVLEASAKGVGPFPLPKLEETLFQFWAFKSSAGGVATMPALALQLLAMPHYETWRNLLRAAGVQAAEGWPQRVEDFDYPEGLQGMMGATRAAFRADPELADALRQWLNGPEGAQLSAPQRHALDALLGLYAQEDSRFLNFYGPPGTITTVPYHAVIRAAEGRGLAELPDLSGKVAFVGFSDLYDPGQPDRFFTVFTQDDGVDLSGVEIAATAFANLHARSSLIVPGNTSMSGLLLAFGLVVGLLLYLLSPYFAVPLTLLLAGLYTYTVQQLFTETALWLPLATPMLVQLPLAMLIGLLGQYLFERRQKQRFSAAVSYYLPDSVAHGLIGEGADLSEANQVLYSACLATDMAGFTTLGERMAPGELATFMNDYFEDLAEPLKRHAVSVTEFRADAIMCAWTAEQADVAVRRQAAFAALDAVDAVAAFSERKQHSLACRVGLDVGHVYVGHAGGGGHFVYSIVGDCANTAARVESLNKHLGTQVLATGSAVEGLDELLLRRLGRFVFVGKQAPLPVMELVAYRSDATHDQLEYCDRFAAALDAFEARRWDQAQAQFEAFASIDKTDQISQIYLRLCKEYRAVEPQVEDPCAIVLDRK